MNIKTVVVSSIAVVAVGTVAQSCLAVATSSIGLSILKKVLLGGISKGVGIFSDKDAFLKNDLMVKALPDNLRSVYNTLGRIAPNLTSKSKEYVAKTAAYTVNVSEPILTNAVNNLTAEDVERVVNGGSGAATRLLKEKTAQQIIQAIQPKVDEKLNEFGVVKTLNTALQGNNLLGGLFGNRNTTEASSISRLVSQQLVNGLFFIIEDYEKDKENLIKETLGKK